MAASNSQIPTTQKAIVVTDDEGNLAITSGVGVVKCAPDGVLVKTHALALNPVDTKMMRGFLGEGCVLGFDFSGVVVEVGSAVPASRNIHIGDRVFGCADGVDVRRPLAGAFAEYTTSAAPLVIKMHPDQSFEDGAAMGTAVTSAGLALFRQLQLPATIEHPTEKPKPVLVWGGATSTGTMMLQLLKLAGYTPIATASPSNFDLVMSYGAEKVFDYHSPTCAQDIKEYTKNALAHAVDCVTVPSSTKGCYAALGRAGGRYAALDPYEESAASRKVVKPGWILATTATGHGSSWPEPYGRPGDADTRAWAEGYLAGIERVLATGPQAIRAHPVRIREGGLEGIMKGIDEIRRKEVRGFKLVYPVE